MQSGLATGLRSRCKARRIAGRVIRGAVSTFAPRRCRGLLLLAELLQGQEPVGQHHQAGMVMEPAPRPALEMIQAQFLLHLLIALLHRPAALPQPDRLDPAGPRRQVREGILDLPIAPLLDQQPDRDRRRRRPLGPSPVPARPGPRRTSPTTSPWSPRARSPSDAAGPPPGTSGSPVAAGPPPAGAAAATVRPSLPAAPPVPGGSHTGSSVKTTVSGDTPRCRTTPAAPAPRGTAWEAP